MGESVSMEARGIHRRGMSPPLNRIADHCAIFLDFDGTLMNLEHRPDQVVVDGGLLYLLDELYVATAGAVALISDRAIEDLDAMLAPLRLPVAGIHGAHRRANGSIEKHTMPATLVWQTRLALRLRLRHYAGIFVEDKGGAVERFMAEPPFAGRFPIFIGDDQTDRAGFEAVARVHGMGIAVGPRVTAPWWLPDPVAVREWLRGCLGLAH